MLRTGLALALYLAVSGQDVEAAPIPGTALSQSLQVRSELLLQDEACQYLFPQIAAGAPSALFGFGASSDQIVAGSGVRAAFDASSFSFLALRDVPFATATSASGPVYQVGWATRTGGLRLGGAYAWSILADRLRETHTGDRHEGAQSEFLTLAHHQASLGVGWGNAVTAVDLVAELRWERLDYQLRDVEIRSAPFSRTFEEVTTKVDGDPMPGIAVRARTPLGSWLGLSAFGSFREGSFDVTHRRRFERIGLGGAVDADTSETLRDTGQSWSTGALLEVGNESRLALHGFWESTREPARHVPEDFGQQERTEIEALRIGVSGAHDLARATTLHAGWSMTDRREVVTRDHAHGFQIEVRVEEDHSVSHDFGWGATHTFWLLDLTGSVAHDLSLDNLFLLLDLRARF